MSSDQPRVITIRLTPAMHADLRRLSFARETSMNLLCTSLIASAVKRWQDEQEREQAGRENIGGNGP